MCQHKNKYWENKVETGLRYTGEYIDYGEPEVEEYPTTFSYLKCDDCDTVLDCEVNVG